MCLTSLSPAVKALNHLWRRASCNAQVQARRSSRSSLPRHLRHLHALRDDDEIFRYSSGRWLYNEALRLDERRLKFKVPELLCTAASAVNRPVSDVQSFTKIAEGGFNRVFRITMQDGFSLIARMPYPSTQPKQLATASEVATIDFLRRQSIPTPRIYHYAAQSANDVGTEFILMEDMQGQALAERWFHLDARQRTRLLERIVEIESKLFSIDLPAFGSLFYEKDLPRTFERRSLSYSISGQPLCVGPDVSLQFWFGTREGLPIRRAPAESVEDVLVAGAAKELAWLKAHGRPRFPFDRVYRDITSFQKSDPKSYMANLRTYMQIAPQLVPKQQGLHRPILRHPDLTVNNVFVNDELEITGVLDWQHSHILPLFLSAGIPSQFQNYGDPVSDQSIEPAVPDLQGLDEEEKQQDLELYRKRHTHFFYLGATAKKLTAHFDALMQEGGMFLRRLYQHASEPWEGNNIPLSTHLALIPLHWNTLVGPSSCPLPLDEQATNELVGGLEKQDEADGQMVLLRNSLGISEDGWVSNDGYDHAKAEAVRFKREAISDAEDDHEREMTIRHWPFEDHDEDE